MGEPNGAKDRAAELTRRSGEASAASHALASRSGAARRRLHPPVAAPPAPPAPDDVETGAVAEAQLHRRHVLIVNRDPAFLDLARVLLQGAEYNVTTTNLVARTHAMILAAAPDALVLDLSLGQPQIWRLVAALQADATTRGLPVVFTARDAGLLERAQAAPWPAGRRFVFAKPFDPAVLLDAVAALVGAA